MSKSSEIPLHVYQVLEEEYVSLHGSLEEDDVLALPHEAREDKRRGAGDGRRRKVRARRDWFFHRGHVKDPVGFVLRLRPSLAGESAGTAAPRRAARQPDDISNHLSKWIPEDVARDVYEFVGPFSGDVNRLFDDAEGDAQDAEGARARRALDRLEESLNRLLADESFYDERAFLNVRLGEATSALVENVAPSGARGESYRDDLAHFNRLLLEDAFPEELERVHNVRLAAVQRRFHLKRQAALCLSGGGIRSGTFALGLIQGLARHNLLGHFQYLSTVSGGGYIGGWLSAWMRRHRDGLGGVTEELRKTPPDSKIDPDPEPIRYLRQYSNFITPKVGLMSADTWAFVAIYLRNLLLNWVVLIPLALGVLALPRLYVSAILAPLGWEWTNPAAAAVQATRATQIVQTTQAAPPVEARRLMSLLPSAFESRHVLLLIGFVLAVCAVAYVVLNRPFLREQLKQRSPFWYKRTGQSSFILCCLAPLVLGAICLTVYWAWSLYAWRTHESLVDQDKPVLSYVAFGAAMNLFGWLLASLILRRFTPSYWRELKRGELVTLLWELAALVAVGGGGAYLFKLAEDASSPVVAYVGTHWTTWTTELYACLAVPGFLVAFLLAMTLFIGLTSHFSLFTDEDREWWARAGAWLLITIIAWVTFSGLVIFGPLALLASPTLLGSVGGASGLAALLAGRSSKTGANDEHAAEGGLLSSLMGVLLPVLAAVFIAVFVAVLSLLTSAVVVGVVGYISANPPRGGLPASLLWFAVAYPLVWGGPGLQMTHLWSIHYAPFWLSSLGLAVAPFALGLVAARLINLNRFSLHAGYRDRLIRGFLGASRGRDERKPNPFTGFDPADNIRMHELRPALLREADFTEDLAGLAHTLSLMKPGNDAERRRDPFSAYLYDTHLDAETRRLLDSYSPDSLPPQALKVALTEDLNEALQGFSHSPSALRKVLDAPGWAGGLARRGFGLTGRPAPADDPPLYDALDNGDHPLFNFEPFVSLRADERVLRSLSFVRRSPQSVHALVLNRHVLQSAYPDQIRSSYPPPPHKLLHVVNTSLNLVGGHNLAWQQRKAEPFTVSPLHAGCFRLGYRKASDYGGPDGISLGTAVAISGAAASSNMGYYTTSPVLAMVMTLFNVRLGWWLGNPGPAGRKTYWRQSPIYSVAPVVAEAFGLTDDTNKYVYLTDGGHFENLALYEMVLRRCHLIVLSDAAADPGYEFNDLGNAVRKIRIDLGIPIEFDDVPIYPKAPDAGEGSYWAVGRIRYSCVDEGADDGLLVYVKPAVYGGEPRDVLNYKKSHAAFPHESTADQFFDEPQFESYRMLGSHIADRMFGEGHNDLELERALAALYWREPERWPDLKAAWLAEFRPTEGESAASSYGEGVKRRRDGAHGRGTQAPLAT